MGILSMSEEYHEARLDHPCAYCKCLELDDAQLGGKVEVDSSGKSRVSFGKAQEPTAECFRDYYRPADNNVIVRVCQGPELQLSYRRQDMFPNLSSLAKTASQGCEFCALLRQDLLSLWLNEENLDNMRARVARRAGLFGHRFPSWTRWYSNITKSSKTFGSATRMADQEHAEAVTADNESLTDGTIDISHVQYQYRHFDWLGGDEKGLPWLDTLVVRFVIVDGETYMTGALVYNVSTDLSDKCSDWLGIWRRPVVQEGPCLERLNCLLEEAIRRVPPPEKDLYLPTRLIDVGSLSQPTLRLIVSKDHLPFLDAVDPMTKRYVALSYCWGSAKDAEKQLKTTRNTLSSHLDHLQQEKLPQTIADAVELCRELNIRYLWVDALCIIQGDSDDWARESFEMSNVYANSLWTVCVLRGSSCLNGFLHPRKASHRLTVSFRSALDASVSGKYYLTAQGHYGPLDPGVHEMDRPGFWELFDSAWTKRGWTFQEGQLSKRVIFFGDRMFHVSCTSFRESEDGSEFYYDSIAEKFSQPTEPNPVNLLNDWYGWVQRYSEKDLTVIGDKLPALSAITRIMSGFLPGVRYLAGLWEEDIQRGLFWTAGWKTSSPREYIQGIKEEYIAPSWSWACQPDRPEWIWKDDWRHPFTREFELRDIKLETDPGNPYGRISGGYILLNAKMFRVPSSPHGWRSYYNPVQLLEKNERPEGLEMVSPFHLSLHAREGGLHSREGGYFAHIALDYDHRGVGDLHSPREPHQLWMVWIASTKSDQTRCYGSYKAEDSEITLGLLLTPDENGDGFLRVGLFCSKDNGLGGKKFWEHIQPCEVKLV